MAPRSLGRHSLWGLTFPFCAGLLLSMSRDLTESLATCLLFAGILLIQRKREWLGAVLLCLAALTRETALVYSALALAVGLWHHWRSRRAQQPLGPRHYLFFAAPLVMYALWQAALSAHWGDFGWSRRGVGFDWPGAAIAAFIRTSFATATHEHVVWLIELTFLGVFALAVLWTLRTLGGRLTREAAAWLGYGVFALTWSQVVWREDWGYMRLLSEFLLLGTMLLLAAPFRLRVPVLAASLALWLFLATDVVLYR